MPPSVPKVRVAVSALTTAGTTASGWTATSSSTDLAASERAPRRLHWHRPTLSEPFDGRSAWMSWGAHPPLTCP